MPGSLGVQINASAPLSPGDPERVGPYELIGRLGSGGMGVVYLGRDGDREVAVKVVKRAYADNHDFATRFRAEVENAGRVASFCTALVLGHGDTDTGAPYMVTEYIKGTPLNRQIEQLGPLDSGSLHGVAFGVAGALTAIHAAGLVHRDLKPANVILSMSGPRVIDFGVSRAIDATHGDTETGQVVGTPGWWAPEQLQGRIASPAADVFTWGCLVAYAGTGRHPFGEGDPLVLAHRVLEAEPDLEGLPESVTGLVRRALAKEPEHRPAARELMLSLVDGGESPNTAVLPWGPLQQDLTPAPQPRRRGRRWGWPLALVVAGALAALGLGLYLGLRSATEPPQQQRSDVGRRLVIGDVHLVFGPVTCAKRACDVRWTMINTGGAPVPLGEPMRLIDDTGAAHQAAPGSRPAQLPPGDRVDLTAAYTLPEGRVAERLSGRPVATGLDVVVRL